jgi:hypothetical protein
VLSGARGEGRRSGQERPPQRPEGAQPAQAHRKVCRATARFPPIECTTRVRCYGDSRMRSAAARCPRAPERYPVRRRLAQRFESKRRSSTPDTAARDPPQRLAEDPLKLRGQMRIVRASGAGTRSRIDTSCRCRCRLQMAVAPSPSRRGRRRGSTRPCVALGAAHLLWRHEAPAVGRGSRARGSRRRRDGSVLGPTAPPARSAPPDARRT